MRWNQKISQTQSDVCRTRACNLTQRLREKSIFDISLLIRTVCCCVSVKYKKSWAFLRLIAMKKLLFGLNFLSEISFCFFVHDVSCLLTNFLPKIYFLASLNRWICNFTCTFHTLCLNLKRDCLQFQSFPWCELEQTETIKVFASACFFKIKAARKINFSPMSFRVL